MRIEQRAQRDYSQLVSSLIGRGSKNSGPTRNLPFNDPGWRLPFTSPTGTSRATGFDPRAIITSSPSDAFSISRERLVLAWWMVTILIAAPQLTDVSSLENPTPPCCFLPTTSESIRTFTPGKSMCGKAATKSARKVLKSSPWARHIRMSEDYVEGLSVSRINTCGIHFTVRKYNTKQFPLFCWWLLKI